MKLGFQISILQFNHYLKIFYKTNFKKMIINNLKIYLMKYYITFISTNLHIQIKENKFIQS